MAAYNIQPFQLLQPQSTNTNPVVGYENGIGNPNDYEYFVDPQTRTVKRRAKQGLAPMAGLSQPASGGDSGGFTPAPSASSTWGTGRNEGPSLAREQAALTAMKVGGAMSKAPGLIGLLGYGIQALGRSDADRQLDYRGENYGLLDQGPVAGTGMYTVSDQSGNVFNMSNAQSIQDQNVANFGISGFDTGLGGYTGMSSENNNAETSGSPGYGEGGFL
jgi:hypothetical protein